MRFVCLNDSANVEENDSQSDAQDVSGANGCHHDLEGASSSKTLNEFDPDEDDEDSDDEDDQEEVSELSSWFDRDSMAFLLSVGAHILVVVGLASITIATQPNLLSVFIDSSPIAEELAPLDVVTDIDRSTWLYRVPRWLPMSLRSKLPIWILRSQTEM
jgi:hypothetical protein